MLLERKMVVSRRGVLLTALLFVITIASAAVAALNLASPFLPSYINHVQVQVPNSQTGSISYIYGEPQLTFQTSVLNANTTLQGNVTLCCLPGFPNFQSSPYPQLFIFSASQYSALTSSANTATPATPWNVPSEASIRNNPFANYTLNGQTGTSGLLIQFTTKETSVYYFVVEGQNGETRGTLYLTRYESRVVRPWDLPVQVFSAILSIVSLVINAIVTYRTLRAPEERIRFYPRTLTAIVAYMYQ